MHQRVSLLPKPQCKSTCVAREQPNCGRYLEKKKKLAKVGKYGQSQPAHNVVPNCHYTLYSFPLNSHPSVRLNSNLTIQEVTSLHAHFSLAFDSPTSSWLPYVHASSLKSLGFKSNPTVNNLSSNTLFLIYSL